jgi:hypothetical protein
MVPELSPSWDEMYPILIFLFTRCRIGVSHA